jgi:hypothetical protein
MIATKTARSLQARQTGGLGDERVEEVLLFSWAERPNRDGTGAGASFTQVSHCRPSVGGYVVTLHARNA